MAKTKLSPNSTKCHLVNIHKNNHNSSEFEINDTELPLTKLFKDLGIFIADKLKWNHHINYIYKFTSTTSVQLLKSFKTSDKYIPKKLYLVYIRSKLEYNTLV